MPNTKRRTDFFVSQEGIDVRQMLQLMELNSAYSTASSYTPTSLKYPSGLRSFADKHMDYLNGNPQLDARMYLANLRLMTRVDTVR